VLITKYFNRDLDHDRVTFVFGLKKQVSTEQALWKKKNVGSQMEQAIFRSGHRQTKTQQLSRIAKKNSLQAQL
jgi:hypothetical protein